MIIPTLFLLVGGLTTVSAAAARLQMCPPASAFTHVPGKKWIMNPYYSYQWQIEDNEYDSSPMKKLPRGGAASVHLCASPPTFDPYYDTCQYGMGDFAHLTVRAKSKTALFSIADLRRIVTINPNFFYLSGRPELNDEIFCHASNGRINIDCNFANR